MSEMGADFERKAESNGSRARRGKRRGASVSEPPGPTAPTSNSTNRMIPRKRLQEYCPLSLDQEVRVRARNDLDSDPQMHSLLRNQLEPTP